MNKKNGFMKYLDQGQAPLLPLVKGNFHFLLWYFRNLLRRTIGVGKKIYVFNQYSMATGFPSL